MARWNNEIQEVADSDNNEKQIPTTLDLERLENFLSQRLEKLKVELENSRIANREINIRFIFLELLQGRRRDVADLPADVVREIRSMVDKRLKDVKERLQKLRPALEGSPASPVEEAYEPQVAPEVVVALQAADAPPLGLPAVAPPAAPAPGGEARY